MAQTEFAAEDTIVVYGQEERLDALQSATSQP